MRLRSCACIGLGSLPFLAVLALACSGPQDDPNLGAQSAGGAPTATGSKNLHGMPERPPTLDECRAKEVPAGQTCHWALLASSYCGGAPPFPQLFWPHCACEVCGVDADCPSGTRCATLPTDEGCNPVKTLCLGPTAACTEQGGCKPDEQCMWIDGKAACKVPTPHMPPP